MVVINWQIIQLCMVKQRYPRFRFAFACFFAAAHFHPKSLWYSFGWHIPLCVYYLNHKHESWYIPHLNLRPFTQQSFKILAWVPSTQNQWVVSNSLPVPNIFLLCFLPYLQKCIESSKGNSSRSFCHSSLGQYTIIYSCTLNMCSRLFIYVQHYLLSSQISGT